MYVSRSLRAGDDVIPPCSASTSEHFCRAPLSPACKNVEGTLKGGEEFLRDTDSKSTLPPFSYSLHGKQGPAQSNGVGGGEDRLETRTSVLWFSGCCFCPLRDRRVNCGF